MYITGVYDILLVLGIMTAMILYGSEVNKYFGIFKGIFIQYKNHFFDIKTRMEQIRKMKTRKSKSLEVMRDIILSYKFSPEQGDKYLDENIQYLEMVIQNLEYESETNPLRLMGFTPTPELMRSVYMGGASLLFAGSQILYSRHFSS